MKNFKMQKLYKALLGLTFGFVACAAQAGVICGSSGSLSACADFELSGNTLTVTLSNTSAADVLVPTDVLTAVFFDYAGILTPVSALSGGNTYLNGVAISPAGTNVGGEWAYGTGFAGPLGSNSGISSAGYGLFGNGNFGGASLDPPVAVDGLNYGILSAGDDPATGNAAVLGNPLTLNSVIFTLTGPNGISLADFSRFSFQYGTALDEPNVPGGGQEVPEPGVVALLGLGLVGLAGLRRRRR